MQYRRRRLRRDRRAGGGGGWPAYGTLSLPPDSHDVELRLLPQLRCAQLQPLGAACERCCEQHVHHARAERSERGALCGRLAARGVRGQGEGQLDQGFPEGPGCGACRQSHSLLFKGTRLPSPPSQRTHTPTASLPRACAPQLRTLRAIRATRAFGALAGARRPLKTLTAFHQPPNLSRTAARARFACKLQCSTHLLQRGLGVVALRVLAEQGVLGHAGGAHAC